MREYLVAPTAERDILLILERSLENFGARACDRYADLIYRAIRDVAKDPQRPGIHHRPELAADARTYHISHSSKSTGQRVALVKRPRHVLVFRQPSENVVEVGRVLHDSMDLARHLPPGYAAE